MNIVDDLKDSIMHGAVKRIRPKLMTVGVTLAGLILIMFSHGAGSDVMKRIAAPMIGGIVTSEILELTIYPAIYLIWKGRKFKKKTAEAPQESIAYRSLPRTETAVDRIVIKYFIPPMLRPRHSL